MPDPKCRLYLITPPVIADLRTFGEVVREALSAGDVAALQIRLKDVDDEAIDAAVRTLQPVARAHGVALILNDRPDLASRLDCDGVHIGQNDGGIEMARRLVGSDRIVGVTCHDSRDLAMEAADAGADYVAFGAFFPTQTKLTRHTPNLEILSIWQETMLTPCVAIGGVTVENCRRLAAAGADFLAVSAGVWAHRMGAADAVTRFNRQIAEGLVERLTPQE